MAMKRVLSSAFLLLGVCAWCGAADFQPPVLLKADGMAIRVESPGYAAPCLADINGNGKKDLLVGQFAGGKIKVYKNLGGGKFGAGSWLHAGGKVAEVPGVW
jgi:hypothetical protein